LTISSYEFRAPPCGRGTQAHIRLRAGRRQSRAQAGARSCEAAHRRYVTKNSPQLCGLCELCGEKRHKYITYLILNYWRRIQPKSAFICVYLRFVFLIRIGCIGFYRRAEQLKLFNYVFVRVPCAPRCRTSPHPPACGRRRSCAQAGRPVGEAAYRRYVIKMCLSFAVFANFAVKSAIYISLC
jgi:hypothetical protein